MKFHQKWLKSKKAPGWDKIDGIALKKKWEVRVDHFPSQWKCAEIIGILKPNKAENEVTLYRPISLLSIFSKVFKKIILKRMLSILEEFAIIPKHQFGFGRGHGTPEQCHRIKK